MSVPVFPRDQIDAVFLDVGGTLVGMDYQRMAHTLSEHGLNVSADQVFRAEAGARPSLSAAMEKTDKSVAEDFFSVLMSAIIENLPAPQEIDKDAASKALTALIPADGHHKEFWNTPLPGAYAGLKKLHASGMPLIAVSNSDGSAEPVLIKAGLRDFFKGVIDSHHVGISKPDPAIFDFAFDLAPVARDKTLYLGDIYAGDVIASRAAGMLSGLVDPFGDYKSVDCPCYRDIDHLATTLNLS